MPEKLQNIKEHQLNAFPDDQTYGSLTKFRKWIEEKKFDQMNGLTCSAHYDWWMFPCSSTKTKLEFKVNHEEVEELKKNTEFMTNYREGVRLQMLSYGWDTNTNSFITDT